MHENDRDTLGNRMKVYEANATEYSGDALPVVIRLDGSAFHTWTRKAMLKKPFDMRLIRAMQNTTLALCGNIPGCVMGYTQSDEISLAIRCDQSEKSKPWFGNRMQKLCSISASICTAWFNEFIAEEMRRPPESALPGQAWIASPAPPKAYFDSRVIYMPTADEVINCFIWRQNDCIKNSVSSMAQSMFSQRQLSGKRRDEQIAMMMESGFDWNSLEPCKKYGTLVHMRKSAGEYNGVSFERSVFFIDDGIRKFTDDRGFLQNAYDFRKSDCV